MPHAFAVPEDSPRAAPADAGPTRELLSDILDRVDAWLKFAEAKNLTVTALTGTASGALIGLLRGADTMPPLAAAAFSGAEIAFLAALGTAIWSFRPYRVPVAWPARPAPGTGDNLLYSGHLAAYGPEDLAAEVAGRYAGVVGYDPADHPLHVALAGQIVVNAVITNAKLRAFNRASFFVLVGLVLLAAGLVVELVR